MKLILCICLLTSLQNSFKKDREIKISQFINFELKYYPETQLANLYKNYFQDAFGPGHLIPDTTHAGEYIDWELEQPFWTDSLPIHVLGINPDKFDSD